MSFAACGGDDKLSKTELAGKANAICKELDKKVAEVPRPTGARGIEPRIAYFERTRPIIGDAVDKLERLEPQDTITKDWETYIDKQNDAVRLLDDLVEQIRNRDPAAQRTLAQLNSAVVGGSAAARRIGADACATASSSPS